MKSADMLTGFIGIVGGILSALFSARYGLGGLQEPGAGFLPFVASIVLAFLSFLLLLKGITNKSKFATEKIHLGPHWRNGVYLMGAAFLSVALWDVLGFLLNIFFFLTFLLKGIGKESLKRSLVISVVVTLVSYTIFKNYLGCQLPAGILNLKF